jgi:glycosyltransferase involved in cell wall biosynthesis
MNRTEHLKQTLPKNIEDNLSYENLEFLVLDYNSTDGLEEWMETEMKEYIEKGILHYYKTTEPDFFHRSHSRNMILLKASGDIICNIDADNYTGKFFASYINRQFNHNDNILLANDIIKQAKHSEAQGRFCTWKKDFIKVTGYDESMESYGYEDIDLYNRIELLGRTRVSIDNLFLNYISHGNDERGANESMFARLDKFLIRYVNEVKSEVLMLFKDKRFEKVNLLQPTEYSVFQVMATIEENSIKKGEWQTTESKDIVLTHESAKKEILVYHDSMDQPYYVVESSPTVAAHISMGEKKFMYITHHHFIQNFMIGFSKMINLEKLKKNAATKTLAVNIDEIGQGIVYKNFEHKKSATVQL